MHVTQLHLFIGVSLGAGWLKDVPTIYRKSVLVKYHQTVTKYCALKLKLPNFKTRSKNLNSVATIRDKQLNKIMINTDILTERTFKYRNLGKEDSIQVKDHKGVGNLYISSIIKKHASTGWHRL